MDRIKKILRLGLVYIIVYVFLYIPIVEALQGNGTTWNINMYQSNGAINQNLTNYQLATGQGQNTIGRVEGTTHTSLVGIFYILPTGYTYAVTPTMAYLFQIADYGMEWVKLNWTTS